MRPAEGEAELLTTPSERGIAAVTVALQDAGIASQVRFGALTLAIGSINVGHQRWIIAAPWSIVAGIGSKLAGLGPTPPGIEHRGGRLVSEQSLGSSQLFEDAITQRAQVPCRPANPIGQGGPVELDILTGVNLSLAVKWNMVGVLGDQHLRDQRLGRNATLDDPRGRRCLDDRTLARAAAITRAARDQHAERGGQA